MALETVIAVGSTPSDARLSHGMGGDVKGFSRTLEITAGADTASDYVFGYVPADCRILGSSSYSIDDNDTGSSATLDFGLYAVDGNITSDDDCLNDGIVLGTAATRQPLIKNIANYGKRAWQHVSGQTTNPKGQLLLKGVIRDASPSAGGTVTVEVFFTVP